jgi:hypothetical protein
MHQIVLQAMINCQSLSRHQIQILNNQLNMQRIKITRMINMNMFLQQFSKKIHLKMIGYWTQGLLSI